MLPLIALLLISQQPIFTSPEPLIPFAEGVASYYTIASSSTLTASGEPMVDEAFTCAMLIGEFGSHYRITAENGRSVVCRLNDRGPYIKGRIIDLSHAAMRALHPEAGLLKVRIERIPESAVPSLF